MAEAGGGIKTITYHNLISSTFVNPVNWKGNVEMSLSAEPDRVPESTVNQRFREHLQQHNLTTDMPACLYCRNREVQSDTKSLQAGFQVSESLFPRQFLTHDSQDDPLPCFFHLIVGCNVSFQEFAYEDWSSHIISYFGAAGPPS